MSREIDDAPAELLRTPPRRLDPRRLYPALVFIPFFYLLVQHFPPIAFLVFVLAAACVAVWEFHLVYFGESASRTLLALSLIGVVGLFFLTDRAAMEGILPALFLLTLMILTGFLLAPGRMNTLLPKSAISAFSVCYVGGCLAHLILIRHLPDGHALVFFVVITTWLADTGAYYTGVLVGRTPLAPRLSPKKTIEGLIGGMVAAVAAALLSIVWFVPAFTLLEGLVLGIAVTIIGLIGDLSESAFKRLSGVKDSSMLIPGHGGVLDRLDSLLLTAPCLYYYVVVVKQPLAL